MTSHSVPTQPTTGGGPSTGEALWVETEAQAGDLARWLLDPERTRPVLVVSTLHHQPDPELDASGLAATLADRADVYVVVTGPASFAFARVMPARTEVYGGAARVYPMGPAWTEAPELSPLRFLGGPGAHVATAHQVRRATELLLDDCRAAAIEITRPGDPDTNGAASTVGPAAATLPAASRRVAGTVRQLVADRALVKLADGTASVDPACVAGGVSIGQLLRPGMQVWGDVNAGLLDVSAMRRPEVELLAGLDLGAVIWVRLSQVRRQSCQAEPLPGRPVWVAVPGVADLRMVFTAGDVAAARVVAVDQAGGPTELDLELDADTADVDPPALLVGGPGWLAAPAPDKIGRRLQRLTTPAVPDLAADAESEPPHTGRAAAVDQEYLLEELAGLAAQVEGLHVTVAALRAEVQQLRDRSGAREAWGGRHPEVLFDDPGEQLRFDLEQCWARRTTPAEKRHLVMRAWTVGPQFFASWAGVQGIDRGKVVEVIVDLLVGRAYANSSRQIHQLRTGAGGDDPTVVRADGATCWRIALQRKTPAARRLHYWETPDGAIELSSIRLHDDYQP